jgi:hypothetical protein
MAAAAPVTINIPFVAALQSDGAANLQTVQAATFTFAGDADVVLAGALTANIINAFTISQEDPSDSTVSLVVTMANQAAFRDALAAAMAAATISTADDEIHVKYKDVASGEGGGVGNSLENYIKAAIHTDVITALASNTIAAELEASDVGAVTLDDFAGDCSGAANAMWEGLDALNAELRVVVATQVPNSKYTEDGEGFTSTLPLTAGDKMVFRFILNSNLTISESAQDKTNGEGTADGAGPGVGNYGGATANILASSARVVELVLTVAE